MPRPQEHRLSEDRKGGPRPVVRTAMQPREARIAAQDLERRANAHYNALLVPKLNLRGTTAENSIGASEYLDDQHLGGGDGAKTAAAFDPLADVNKALVRAISDAEKKQLLISNSARRQRVREQKRNGNTPSKEQEEGLEATAEDDAGVSQQIQLAVSSGSDDGECIADGTSAVVVSARRREQEKAIMRRRRPLKESGNLHRAKNEPELLQSLVRRLVSTGAPPTGIPPTTSRSTEMGAKKQSRPLSFGRGGRSAIGRPDNNKSARRTQNQMQQQQQGASSDGGGLRKPPSFVSRAKSTAELQSAMEAHLRDAEEHLAALRAPALAWLDEDDEGGDGGRYGSFYSGKFKQVKLHQQQQQSSSPILQGGGQRGSSAKPRVVLATEYTNGTGSGSPPRGGGAPMAELTIAQVAAAAEHHAANGDAIRAELLGSLFAKVSELEAEQRNLLTANPLRVQQLQAAMQRLLRLPAHIHSILLNVPPSSSLAAPITNGDETDAKRASGENAHHNNNKRARWACLERHIEALRKDPTRRAAHNSYVRRITADRTHRAEVAGQRAMLHVLHPPTTPPIDVSPSTQMWKKQRNLGASMAAADPLIFDKGNTGASAAASYMSYGGSPEELGDDGVEHRHGSVTPHPLGSGNTTSLQDGGPRHASIATVAYASSTTPRVSVLTAAPKNEQGEETDGSSVSVADDADAEKTTSRAVDDDDKEDISSSSSRSGSISTSTAKVQDDSDASLQLPSPQVKPIGGGAVQPPPPPRQQSICSAITAGGGGGGGGAIVRPVSAQRDARIATVRQRKAVMDAAAQEEADRLDAQYQSSMSSSANGSGRRKPLTPRERRLQWEASCKQLEASKWASLVVVFVSYPMQLSKRANTTDAKSLLARYRRDDLVKRFAACMMRVVYRRRHRRAKVHWAVVRGAAALVMLMVRQRRRRQSVMAIIGALRETRRRKPTMYFLHRFYHKCLRAQKVMRGAVAKHAAQISWLLAKIHHHETSDKGTALFADDALDKYPSNISQKPVAWYATKFAQVAGARYRAPYAIKRKVIDEHLRHRRKEHLAAVRKHEKAEAKWKSLTAKLTPEAAAQVDGRPAPEARPYLSVVPTERDVLMIYRQAQKRFLQSLQTAFTKRRKTHAFLEMVDFALVFDTRVRDEGTRGQLEEAAWVSGLARWSFLVPAVTGDLRVGVGGNMLKLLTSTPSFVPSTPSGRSRTRATTSGSTSEKQKESATTASPRAPRHTPTPPAMTSSSSTSPSLSSRGQTPSGQRPTTIVVKGLSANSLMARPSSATGARQGSRQAAAGGVFPPPLPPAATPLTASSSMSSPRGGRRQPRTGTPPTLSSSSSAQMSPSLSFRQLSSQLSPRTPGGGGVYVASWLSALGLARHGDGVDVGGVRTRRPVGAAPRDEDNDADSDTTAADVPGEAKPTVDNGVTIAS